LTPIYQNNLKKYIYKFEANKKINFYLKKTFLKHKKKTSYYCKGNQNRKNKKKTRHSSFVFNSDSLIPDPGKKKL